MSVPALPGDPDEFLPRHISGRVMMDPYETLPRMPRRVRAEMHLVPDDDVIDLVAIEAEEAELLGRGYRASDVSAARAAYEGAQDLASDTVSVPRYELDVCEAGHLHRSPILPGVPG